MSGNGNAVDWFVDRNLRESRGDAPAFIDPWRALTYAALCMAGQQRHVRAATRRL